MTLALPALRPASYASSPLHSSERVWSQSNCYVDLWIEVLHSLGLDPRAAGAFTLSADFEGDQWAFFKPPVEDLRALCGIDVAELNVWRPLVDHIGEQLDFGRLLTVEVDAFHLPDTVGVSYRTEHVKTTIAPAWIEQNARQLRYFHNAGLHELEGEDFDALIGTRCAGPHALAPYVEIIKLDRLCRDEGRLAAVAGELIRSHIGRRAVDNPVRRMNKRISADLDWLRGADVETFHRYTFGTCRQSGASAELAADFIDWFDAHTDAGLADVATHFRSVASAARVVQFNLARSVRGRRFDIQTPLEEMTDRWDRAFAMLCDRYGS
ncbi:MAG: DUF1839 family protein [Actinomycetota bacterium]|nr:DUF1839 family protein [Actinomycetota bacterium]